MALFSWTMTLTKTTRGGSLILVLKIVIIGNSRSAMTLFADAPRGVVWPCTQKLAAWSGLTTYTISYHRRRRRLLYQEPIPGILSLKTTIFDLNIRNTYYGLISMYTYGFFYIRLKIFKIISYRQQYCIIHSLILPFSCQEMIKAAIISQIQHIKTSSLQQLGNT